jgi:pyruvate dehydrogenase E1 component alpha subunit
VGDVDRAYYRPPEEEARWRDERDPIALLADRLRAAGTADDAALAEVDARLADEIAAAAEHALAAPFPDPGEVTQHVYA